MVFFSFYNHTQLAVLYGTVYRIITLAGSIIILLLSAKFLYQMILTNQKMVPVQFNPSVPLWLVLENTRRAHNVPYTNELVVQVPEIYNIHNLVHCLTCRGSCCP